MAINYNKLISSPTFQDYIVDKDTGLPLANGLIRLYKDTLQGRQEYKNWYYQTGVPLNYTYIPLSNPMYLSSVGTIQDPHGNDVIPFFYPFDENDENQREAYYITVDSVDENGDVAIRQFSRENFPFVAPQAGDSDLSTWRNYIINNEYWHNIGSLDGETIGNAIICPSQHDNYNMDSIDFAGNSDIRWIRGIGGSDFGGYTASIVSEPDTVSFLKMNTTELVGNTSTDTNIAPEWYLSTKCTSSSGAATLKCVQYPVSMHLKTLANQPFTFVFWGRNEEGSTGAVDVYLYRFPGTGSTTVARQYIKIGGPVTFSTGLQFQQQIIQSSFPDIEDIGTLGAGADDAYFIQIRFPVSAEYHISHTKPQLYLSNSFPDNDFDTYDQINSIINASRTGDVRISNSNYYGTRYSASNQYSFGWLPMNNGTIGYLDPSDDAITSNATTRANQDTWQLYQMIWNLCQYSQAYAPMYTSAGVQAQYGASAYADFVTDKKQLCLLKALGQVLAGTVNYIEDAQTFTTAFGSDTSLLTISSVDADTTRWGTGTPVTLFSTGTLPTGLVSGVTYYSYNVNKTTMRLMKTEFPAIPSSYIQLANVDAASLSNLTATYVNGVLGVGATLTNNTGIKVPFSLDGVTGVVGNYYLIKNQSSAFQNGIYMLTTLGDASTDWILTRVNFYDIAAQIVPHTYTFVLNGTSPRIGTFWEQTATVTTVGSDSVTFSSLSTTFVTFSSNGTGTHYIQTKIYDVGNSEGERQHLQTTNEVGTHTHNFSFPAGITPASLGGGGIGFVSTPTGAPNYTGSGTQVGFNVMQPTSYTNFFIKL